MTSLLSRQKQLQDEAEQVITELDLHTVLSRAGRMHIIGSAASGLMVWRDLDISIYVETPAGVTDALRELIANLNVLDVHYANETGDRSPSGVHDQRFYAVVQYRAASGELWKIDLSFWTDTGPRGGFSDAAALRSRLTDETRLVILRIKDEWHRLDSYPSQVGGIDVYDAVLNHGIRTPDEFDTYLRERGLPARQPAVDAGEKR